MVATDPPLIICHPTPHPFRYRTLSLMRRRPSEPLTNMEVVKVHAKSDGLAEWVFNTCRSGHYRISVPE